jgi:hypothetical protein
MAVSDFLSDIGGGLATTGRVLGAIGAPVAQSIGNEEAGYAPAIAAQKRAHDQALEDAQIEAKATELKNQMDLGEKYGTLTPEDRQQYVDAITQLYSQPRHAGTLMEKLRQAIHPNGATYTPPEPTLKNPAPAGGTAAADIRNALTLQQGQQSNTLGYQGELSNQSAEIARQNALKDIDFMRQNIDAIFPNASPDDKTRALNLYAERKMGMITGKPMAMKSTITNGVFYGVTDPNTGQQWGINDLQPGGSAPDEAKSLYADYQGGLQEKRTYTEAQKQKQQDEINKRQERSLAAINQRQIFNFQNQLASKDYQGAQDTVKKLQQNYATSQTLEARMQQLAPDALAGNQQAQVAILANHIAMTTHQPGAAMRPTQALFNEAAATQPWMAKITKRFDQDGILAGVVLSPEQIQQMVDLAPIMVNADAEVLKNVNTEFQDKLNPLPAQQGGPHSTPNTKIKTLTAPPGGAGPVKNVNNKQKVMKFNPATGRLE